MSEGSRVFGPILGFDYGAVGDAVEARREELGLTPSGLIRSVNWLSAAPLAKLREGYPNTCQHVIGLLRWLGRSPESFALGMTDRLECQLPHFGPYALRWNMATLWEAVDGQRTERDESWDDVAEATHFPEVEGVRLVTYGIQMHDAMNIVRWLDRPAATFLYPAELNPARPGSAAYRGPEDEEAESSAPSEFDQFITATLGKTDQEIVDFARGHGGFASMCRLIIMWLRPLVVDAGDFEIALALGDGADWTIRNSNGKYSFQYRVKKSANALVHTSPVDFMRLVFQDLDPGTAIASDRVRAEGNTEQVIHLFRSLAPRP